MLNILIIISSCGIVIYILWWLFLLLFKRKTIEIDTSNIEKYYLYLIIPMLDEEKVVHRTITKLKQSLNNNLNIKFIIVDDGSKDNTNKFIKQEIKYNQDNFLLLTRYLPKAQEGKGEALNFALRHIRQHLDFNIRNDYKIIGILDADALIDSNYLANVLSVFNKYEEIGMLQTSVGMMSKYNWLSIMQDFEFRTFNYLLQNVRNNLGNAAASGNGQFFKLSSISDTDSFWGNSLLEDFESSTRLLLSGKKTMFYNEAVVYQEPVTNIKSFLEQRTRWCQGGMQCIHKYLKSIVYSKNLIFFAKFEMIFYLFLPFLSIIFLIGHIVSLIYQIYLYIFFKKIAISLVILAIISLVLNTFMGIIYSKQVKQKKIKSILYAMTVPIYILLLIPVYFKSLFRFLTKKNNWIKTVHGS